MQTTVQPDSNLALPRQHPADPEPSPYAAARAVPNGDSHGDAIAIIGLAGRYPKARNLTEFWENLKNGRDCVTEVPLERWDWRAHYSPDRSNPAKSYTKWGGFLDDIDCFDPLFFGISPRDARLMDPQERLFLECAQETIEDAGYTRQALTQSRPTDPRADVGVFVGVTYQDYQLLGAEGKTPGDREVLITYLASVANRVSYCLNFNGPSLAADTMCSSSLTAIHLACQSLRSGECRYAIAGGVNLSFHPGKYIYYSRVGYVSASGACRSFGEEGDGFVPAEGVGAVLLKPVADAIADGDHIYGLIRATAINHGGRDKGYTTPNSKAQSAMVADALRKAGVHPRAVSYMEAHGTGTAVGDPIELAGLIEAFEASTADRQFCAIGSVKSNIGHCESAAGIAGLTKVLLQMKHGQLVPSLHAEALNSRVPFESSPFHVQRTLGEWERPTATLDGLTEASPRIAGVSSFGAGGSNAHLVVEEFVAPVAPAFQQTELPAFVLLSADTELQLRQQAEDLRNAIRDGFVDADLHRIAYTTQVGREPREFRLGLIAASLSDLGQKLAAHLAGQDSTEGVYRGNATANRAIVSLLAEGRDTENLVEAWAARKAYTKLLDFWVKGLDFDWNFLYPGPKPIKISLPAHRFARERYWIPQAKSRNAAGESTLHPLVHRNTSTLAEQRFTSTFSGTETFLADHVVNGRPTLPAVAYLEMACEAMTKSAREEAPSHSLLLKDVVWAQPYCIEEQSAEIHIALIPGEDGTVEFEVYASHRAAEAGEPAVYARGAAARQVVRSQTRVDLDAIRSSRGRPDLSGDEFYRKFVPQAIQFGPAHRGIARLQMGADVDILAEVFTPQAVADSAYTLHPSLLDAAFQTSLALLPIEGGDPVCRLPFCLDAIEIHAPVPGRAWVWTRYAEGSGPEQAVSKFDISVCDGDGLVAIEIRGLALRAAASSQFRETARPQLSLTPPASSGDVDTRAALEERIHGLVAKALEIPPEQLSRITPFERYGLDSIFIADLTSALQAFFPEIGSTLFFEHPTVEALAGHLIRTDPARAAALPATGHSEPVAPVTPREPSGNAVPTLRRKTGRRFQQSAAPREIQDVAIIGMSGRFPDAANLDEFWENLESGRNCIREIPDSRWDWKATYAPERGRPGSTYTKWGGFLPAIDVFDAEFFGIAPLEAERMDPGERLFLEESYRAIEDAGYTPASLRADRKVGVFVGVINSVYRQPATNWSIANRVSYQFDFQGPSLSIDSACSSSLTAIHLALESIYTGASACAIAGGVHLLIDPAQHTYLCEKKMVSSGGQCKAFGDGADGFVDSEAVGAVLLKPLAAAIADGDRIHGVIKGSSINTGGRSYRYLAPNLRAQAAVIAEAHRRAGVHPRTLSYLEAHGTGTRKGDAIEIAGLSKAFGGSVDTAFCAIGSVKSNIGHAEAAAGITGLMKILLQMKHRKLAASLHAETLNPEIDFAKSPFRVQRSLSDWDRPEVAMDGARRTYPRRAGLSSFGAGGSNAHMVIEEFDPRDADSTAVGPERPVTIVLSAKNPDRLRERVRQLSQAIDANGFGDRELPRIAYTLQMGREEMECRLRVRVASMQELQHELAAFLAGNASNSLRSGSACAPPDYSGDDRPRRIGLPTYPFVGKRYWARNPSSAADESKPAAEPPRTPAEPALLTPVWEVVTPDQSHLDSCEGTVLVIGGAAVQHDAIRLLYPGADFMPADGASSIEDIAEALRRRSAIGQVVWLADAPGEGEESPEQILFQQQQGIVACFRFIKAFLRAGYAKQSLTWTAVTTRSQPVISGETVRPAHAGIHGLLGTLAKEQPEWKIRIVDLEGDGVFPAGEIFALPTDAEGNAWALRNQKWHRLRLAPCPDPIAPVTRYRQGGVYVIVGGAGGIGEAFSEYLIRDFQAQVVWLGRRSRDAAIDAKICRLAAHGPAPLYLQADATDRSALELAAAEIKARYGQIHGVVHSALVFTERTLALSDESRFLSALEAKTVTTTRMIEVFADEPLDFVLFFSSVQSFLKRAGLANYAAGCVFQDCMAAWLSARAPYPVKVMNWGYWGGVGVVATETHRALLAGAGLASIEPAEGMQALEKLLAGPQRQLSFLKQIGPAPLSNSCQEITKLPPPLASLIGDGDTQSAETLVSRLLYASLQPYLAGSASIQAPYLRNRWLAASEDFLRKVAPAQGLRQNDLPALWEEWEQARVAWLRRPHLKGTIRLVEAALRALPDVLEGRRLATDVLFPNSSFELVEGCYANNPAAGYFNETLAKTAAEFVESRSSGSSAPIRILEIGAGTGATSAWVFRALEPHAGRIEEYCFTDVSKSFLMQAEKRFALACPYLTSRKLDIEISVERQGIDPGAFDLVIAANVLHATTNVRAALSNAKMLLKPGGRLLLNEITRNSVFHHVTFGLLSGWWLYEDAALRLPGSPLLTADSWRALLEEEGFRNLDFPAACALPLGQQIVSAESDGVARPIADRTPQFRDYALAAGSPSWQWHGGSTLCRSSDRV